MSRWVNQEFYDAFLDELALAIEQSVCDGQPVSYYEVHNPEHWLGEHTYALDESVRPTTRNGYTYQCTQAGNSGVNQPTWGTTPGGITTDGGVEWTCFLCRSRINVTMAPADFSKSDGTYGRKLTVTQKSDNTVHTTGNIDHVALVRASDLKLLIITPCGVKTVNESNLETINSWAYEFDAPSAYP